MNRFAALFAALDATTRTSEKTAALTAYFTDAPEPDRVWTIALLSGRRPRRAVTGGQLGLWAAEAAGIPDWLFEESYAVVGDLAEAIALLLPEAGPTTAPSLTDTITRLTGLAALSPEARRAAVLHDWASLPGAERFLYNKLLTGGFRMGVAQGLMTRALSAATGVEEATLAHRLMGGWTPATTTFAALIAPDDKAAAAAPYPFALASPLEAGVESLGVPQDWIAEWKWDGIRGQIIHRPGVFAVWSRGEDLITDRFPEFRALADFLPPGTVLDGEILGWLPVALVPVALVPGEAGLGEAGLGEAGLGEAGLGEAGPGEAGPDRRRQSATGPAADRPLPFAALQKRLGRKTVPKALLVQAPARFLAYDLLELDGTDLRGQPLWQRRAALEKLIAALPQRLPLAVSERLGFAGWQGLAALRASAREVGCEGLMLKRAASVYQTGRKRGDWWKWKLDPFRVDAVMIYAQAGHGRRAGLFTDFTFAVRDGADLVPFAKAYSGLTDAEFGQITRWVNAHTLERFGPVRRVPPDLVFEIAFEGIQASPRHKSGIALRFPRMVRWRQDKPASEIDSLDSLRALLASLA